MPTTPDVIACTLLHRRGAAVLAVRPYAVRDADDPGPYFLPGGMPEPGEDEIAEIAWLEPAQWQQFAGPVQQALAQLTRS